LVISVQASPAVGLIRDPFAAVMTAVALGLAAVITWQYAWPAVPAVGLLVFAVVAVQESRGVPA